MRYRNVITPSDHGVMLVNVNDTVIGQSISYFGGWEIKYINFIKELIRRSYPQNSEIDIVDAGANLGVYTLSLATMADYRVKIYAIEAQRLIFQMLNANVALNSLTNVWTYHAVVCEESHKLANIVAPDLDIPANYGAVEITNNLLMRDYSGAYARDKENVMTIAIDQLCLQNCVFIKMDIEGMEDVGLQGAIETIKRSRPVLFFERHKSDYNKIKQLIKPYGYILWELDNDNVLALREESQVEPSPAVKVLL